MPIRSRRLGRGIPAVDADNPWASQVVASAATNIKDMARFQQRQLLEKEQKLLQLYDQQQLRAHQVAQRGSAGSNGSNSSGNGTSSTVSHRQTVTRTTTNTHSTANSQPGGKVRQMFDERRQTTVKGIDKSYPLEPLDNRSRKQQTTTSTTTSNVASSACPTPKNGNPMSNRQSLVVRRTVRSEANSNVNGGKPIVSYREEVTREVCGPTEGDNDNEEFGDVDENHEYRYGNGNRHNDQHSEVQIEDITNENTTKRHRTTAKIHLTEFDGNNEANRFDDNTGNEQFTGNPGTDVPDRLARRGSSTKKPLQTESRLERLKNVNAKRISNTNKQVAGNTTSYTKKRTETSVTSGSTSRASEATTMTEEERSTRGRSKTPEVEETGRPRSSTPEGRSRKLTSPVVDRTSIVTKRSGISKVSQLTHKDSMDFYPRRKSEFEKSKTFRKLQLELGESSPEPAEPEDESTTLYGKQCRKRNTILNENVYKPGRRSSSSSPAGDRDVSEGRRNGREKSPEHSQPTRSSGSPVGGRRPSDSKEETKTSSFQSHTYSSKRRSSSSGPIADRDDSEGRRNGREKSPEHSQPPRSSESPVGGRRPSDSKEETKTSSFQSHTFSSRRRSSSSSPIADRDDSEDRRNGREKSPEHSQPPRSSGSPVGGRRPSDSKEETKTSSFQSHTFSSRRRSSSSGPVTDRDTNQRRRNSREKSPKHSQPPRSSESPVFERRPSDVKDETKTSSFQSHTYSSRRRSSSSSYATDRDVFENRKLSREMSPEQPRSRKGSESPIYETRSTIKTQQTKTIGEGRHSTSVETNLYSTNRRPSSTRPTADSCPSKGRKVVREKSPERPPSRRGSKSPVRETKTPEKKSKIESTKYEVKKTDRETNVYSSRRRSSSSSPTTSRDPDVGRRGSREKSPERPQSRRGSESPPYRRRSSVTIEEIEQTRRGNETSSVGKRSTSPICRRTTSGRPQSPPKDFRRSSTEREETGFNIDRRRTSGGTLRSVELVKKLARPVSPDRHRTTSTRQSSERKTMLEDVEFRRLESRRRSESPTHRVVKKDRAVMEISKKVESKVKNDGRKSSTESRERNVRSRSRTASPSSPISSSMKETASFRAKKAERKNSSETKKIESKRDEDDEKKVHEIGTTNLSHGKARNCDLARFDRSPSPEDDENDRSRRLSTEITVKRRETMKIGEPIERIIKIERESWVDDDEELPIGKTGVTDTKDKSQLFHRIEKIRTTLSKSGKSELDSEESKDFERTDSVESALKRFDSIGAETEHRVTVGMDEIDRSSRSPSPDVIVRSAKEMSAKKSAESRNKPAKIIVASVKTQPRRIDSKARDLSKEKVYKVNVVQKISEAGKPVRAKKEKSIAPTTPRQGTKTRSSQKMTCLVRSSKLRGEESSGRGERKSFDSSPECKKRLFDDSESEIDTDNSRSTVVMTTMTTATMSPKLCEIETRNNGDNRKIGSEKMIRSESNLRDARSDHEQPAKILRSIEDIRQSIKRESQDFKRELNKFNTAMRKDEESSSLGYPDETVTSGIVSCVKITKTLNPGDVDPVIKIERSTVKLPITPRIAKSPSPDIGGKRSTDGRARTPTGSVRRSLAPTPVRTPDATSRYGSADSKSSGIKSLTRTTPTSSATREDRMRSESSRTTEYTDCTDGCPDNSEFTVTEVVSTTTTKTNDGFVIEFDDDDVVSPDNDIASSSPAKPLLRKQSTDKSIASQKQTKSRSTTPLPRPASALSTSSTGSARGQASQTNSKSKMSTKTKISSSSPHKGPPTNVRASTAVPADDGLAPCKICGRRFNSDRVSLHEQICSKTATKKRKQFDATVHRVKGTELEPFVVKKGGAKKGQTDRKTSKPEVKSNWRRKHEDFINAIRSAKQVQAHLAAGGKLSDLPPPPASDTSDYIQCPHCGRKFNQAAADRHIPKCQNMLHNKPNPRAPPKPKR